MVSMKNPDTAEGLSIGTNICVRNGPTQTYFKIVNRDTLLLRDAHAALASAGTETFAEVTSINPTPGQLIQISSLIMDGNVEITLKQPAATNRWGTQRSPTGGLLLDRFSNSGMGQQLNLWILENFAPNVQLVNNTDVSIIPVLWWIGWNYQTEFLAEVSNGRLTKGVVPSNFVEVSLAPRGAG